MLFNSYEFIFLFVPITFSLYFMLIKYNRFKMASNVILIASLCFYAHWSAKYLILLGISIIFNYIVGNQIENYQLKEPKKKAKFYLILGIIINLGLLLYYKYTGFFIDVVNLTFSQSTEIPKIILPLGISFYTFTQIAYLIDSYRSETKDYNFTTYAIFVTFFPHLIAGPILHHAKIIPQFNDKSKLKFNIENFSIGIGIFFICLFKKVMIADALAFWVKPVFDNADQVNIIEAWVGALSYTLQLYFDFSGYSDMAIGLGLMMNIQLPVNFNSPYKATSIIDFWRRWHISLSSFLRDYVSVKQTPP